MSLLREYSDRHMWNQWKSLYPGCWFALCQTLVEDGWVAYMCNVYLQITSICTTMNTSLFRKFPGSDSTHFPGSTFRYLPDSTCTHLPGSTLSPLPAAYLALQDTLCIWGMSRTWPEYRNRVSHSSLHVFYILCIYCSCNCICTRRWRYLAILIWVLAILLRTAATKSVLLGLLLADIAFPWFKHFTKFA